MVLLDIFKQQNKIMWERDIVIRMLTPVRPQCNCEPTEDWAAMQDDQESSRNGSCSNFIVLSPSRLSRLEILTYISSNLSR
jgi:hypothetical protein